MGLEHLPHSKWALTTDQVILLTDLDETDKAILKSFEVRRAPQLSWASVAGVKVEASADSPAVALMAGFPNVSHPGQFLHGGLSDGQWAQITGDISSTLWGAKQNSQWYAAYLLASGAQPRSFSLKLMPLFRVKGLAGQVISCGLNATPATGLKYSLTVNDLIGGQVYFLSGDSRGLLFSITANNENATETTITIDAVASMAQGDWFAVLPAANFRWLGDALVNSSGDFVEFSRDGDFFRFDTPHTINSAAGVNEDIHCAPPLAAQMLCRFDSAVKPADHAEVDRNYIVKVGHPTLAEHWRELVQENEFRSFSYVLEAEVGLIETVHNFDQVHDHGLTPVDLDLCQYSVAITEYVSCALNGAGYRYPQGMLL